MFLTGQARNEHIANSVWRRSISMERGQEAAEEVPAEYHLARWQKARGKSSKYASTSPGADSMLYNRIEVLAMTKEAQRTKEACPYLNL